MFLLDLSCSEVLPTARAVPGTQSVHGLNFTRFVPQSPTRVSTVNHTQHCIPTCCKRKLASSRCAAHRALHLGIKVDFLYSASRYEPSLHYLLSQVVDVPVQHQAIIDVLAATPAKVAVPRLLWNFADEQAVQDVEWFEEKLHQFGYSMYLYSDTHCFYLSTPCLRLCTAAHPYNRLCVNGLV